MEGSRDIYREGGYGERGCSADTYLSEGAFLQDVSDFRNELTLEWTGNNMLSPRRLVQCCLKSGSGTVKYIFLDLELRLTMNWNTTPGE